MKHKIPNFSAEKIAKIAKENFDIEGVIKPLVSYEDQNALITTSKGKFVFKVANTIWPTPFIQAQSDAMAHLKRKLPHMDFAQVVPSREGEEIIFVDGFAIRVLTFLEGEVLANVQRTPALYRDVGRAVGEISAALQDFPAAGVAGSDPLWKLDQVIACKDYVSYVQDAETKDRINRIFADYENRILPVVPQLRKAVIHADANEQNLLIQPERPECISGLIDFGELQVASQVNELAITVAYALLGEENIKRASQEMIAGYEAAFELLPEERDILFSLVAMRLVTSIVMSSYNYHLRPDNDYLMVAARPGMALLKRLEAEKFIL